MIVTIDGPSGTGKSTVARRVAKELHFVFFDTGAMFRTLAWGILLSRTHHANEEEVIAFLKNHPIVVRKVGEELRYFLGQTDATDHLRSPEVSQLASKISTIQYVRQVLKETQQKEAI